MKLKTKMDVINDLTVELSVSNCNFKNHITVEFNKNKLQSLQNIFDDWWNMKDKIERMKNEIDRLNKENNQLKNPIHWQDDTWEAPIPGGSGWAK